MCCWRFADTIDLVDKKPNGVLAVLDSACKTPRGVPFVAEKPFFCMDTFLRFAGVAVLTVCIASFRYAQPMPRRSRRFCSSCSVRHIPLFWSPFIAMLTLLTVIDAHTENHPRLGKVTHVRKPGVTGTLEIMF